MSRFEKIKNSTPSQLAVMIFAVLLADNTPISNFNTIANIVKWLEDEWTEGEYDIL